MSHTMTQNKAFVVGNTTYKYLYLSVFVGFYEKMEMRKNLRKQVSVKNNENTSKNTTRVLWVPCLWTKVYRFCIFIFYWCTLSNNCQRALGGCGQTIEDSKPLQKAVDTPQWKIIEPNSGSPHTLPPMKLGSWLPSESSHQTVVPMVEEDHLMSNSNKLKLDETHAAGKLNFPVESHSTPNSQADQRTMAEVVQVN